MRLIQLQHRITMPVTLASLYGVSITECQSCPLIDLLLLPHIQWYCKNDNDNKSYYHSRAYFSVQLIKICGVVKSKCAVEKVVCALRSEEILVKMMIYRPITRFCAVVNPA